MNMWPEPTSSLHPTKAAEVRCGHLRASKKAAGFYLPHENFPFFRLTSRKGRGGIWFIWPHLWVSNFILPMQEITASNWWGGWIECAGKLIAWHLILHYWSWRVLWSSGFIFAKHCNISWNIFLESMAKANLHLNNSDFKNNGHSKQKLTC